MKYFVGLVCAVVLFVATFFVAQKFEFKNNPLSGTLVAKDKKIEVLFVGDIMMGRNVEYLSKIKSDPNYPFQNIKDFLAESDFVVGNLEGPIMENYVKIKGESLKFSFASTTAKTLRDNGISLVSLGNNHLYDYGKIGFDDTVKYLDSVGIAHAGAPFDTGEQYFSSLEKDGQKIVFVGYNFTNPNFATSTAIEEIKNAKKDPKDYLVVMVHGGNEYKTKSSSREQKFYRALLDAGADAVIAHHPHVTQEVEEYKGKPIFYSLGNFIFDQYFSKEVEQGLAVRLTLSDTLAKYEIIPIQSKMSQPAVASSSIPNQVKTFIR